MHAFLFTFYKRVSAPIFLEYQLYEKQTNPNKKTHTAKEVDLFRKDFWKNTIFFLLLWFYKTTIQSTIPAIFLLQRSKIFLRQLKTFLALPQVSRNSKGNTNGHVNSYGINTGPHC